MKNQINLNIKTPCSENFDQFSKTLKGGFCGSCQKEVIDFTNMNAQETVNYFKNRSTENTCGRFNSSQLQTTLPNEKKLSFWSGIGLACLSLFSIYSSQSQEAIKPLESTDKNPKDIQASQFENNILVKGNVSENSIPLPGASIVLEGSSIGTQTNFDGDFEFPEKLKKGDVLVISYIGFTTQKAVITNEKSVFNIDLKVDMKACDMILMGEVAVKQVYKSNKD